MKVTVSLDDCVVQATLGPLPGPAATPAPSPAPAPAPQPARPLATADIDQVSLVIPRPGQSPRVVRIPEPMAAVLVELLG
jgi:hypothetical protein